MPALHMRLFAGLLALVPWLSSPTAAADALEQKFTPSASSTGTFDHGVWDALLKRYVKPDATGLNRVDYKAWKASDHAALKTYLTALQASEPRRLSRSDAFAFWANLYNARTVDLVLDKYPVKSIKDVSLGGGLKALVGGGPWQAITLHVAGSDLSLDDVENKILRAIFKDPRVHYALNCASYGCPNLMIGAYTGSALEAQLDAGARAFINHPRGVTVVDGKVQASQIYSWFEADFGGSAAKALDHIRRYGSPTLVAKLQGVSTIAGYHYVWTLNDIAR